MGEQAMDISNETVTEETNEANAVEEMDWDNVEETAPSMEEAEGESNDKEISNSEDKDADTSNESVEEDVKPESKDSNEADSDEVQSDSKDKPLSIEDLKDDDKISVKVDGEVQEISLKEFKSGISGQKALSQKWSEVDRVKKQNQTEVDEINGWINNFSSKMKEGNALSAMEYLGSFGGMGSHQIKSELIKALMPDIERMSGMTQSEVDLEYSQKENVYMTEQREKDVKLSETRQAEETLTTKIVKMQTELDIDNGEWDDAVAYLDKHLEPEKAITPELVGEYVQFARSEKQAETLLGGLEGENLSNETNVQALQQIILDNPEFTKEDLVEIVTEGLSIAKKEAVEEKIGKQTSVKKANVKKETKQEDQAFSPILDELGDEILDFADL